MLDDLAAHGFAARSPGAVGATFDDDVARESSAEKVLVVVKVADL
jgi:hypothetical protein